jgi:putative membrane protein
MVLMSLLWIALIGAVVWAVVWLARPPVKVGSSIVSATPRQILDRRFATGEIDETTYTRMRSRLEDPPNGTS